MRLKSSIRRYTNPYPGRFPDSIQLALKLDDKVEVAVLNVPWRDMEKRIMEHPNLLSLPVYVCEHDGELVFFPIPDKNYKVKNYAPPC